MSGGWGEISKNLPMEIENLKPTFRYLWVPVSSIVKVSNDCIRDLGFNLPLHQKLIGVLV